jgi:hypothetical protein
MHNTEAGRPQVTWRRSEVGANAIADELPRVLLYCFALASTYIISASFLIVPNLASNFEIVLPIDQKSI